MAADLCARLLCFSASSDGAGKAAHNEPVLGPWGWEVFGIATACLTAGIVLERVRGKA